MFNARYTNIANAKAFVDKFESIIFNGKYFEFSFDYSNFTDKAAGTRTNWTVCSHGNRIHRFINAEKNNSWDEKTVRPTEMFEDLFRSNGIKYSSGENIKDKITEQNNKDFFVEFYHTFNLMLQMRNSSVFDRKIDYIISPVKNKNGVFFDSREADETMPSNSYASKAYNIARKGVWALEQIRKTDIGNEKLNLAMTNKEWLNYIQGE